MDDLLDALKQQLLDWSAEASANGWLAAGASRSLESVSVATPAALFTEGQRPLVIALYGGTGVGKSSLMNRFADAEVARVSAERPTSRDVTLYAHRSLVVDRLPDTLPLARVRTSLHDNDMWRDVLWLDMPDVDSVEIANRELVERWLPHIDVLLYVVSPERYRDDEGWRLLLANAERHAWLFVMNQWDRGDERQIDDFRDLLGEAGLADPLIFRTISTPPTLAREAPGSADRTERAAEASDDFATLVSSLSELAARQLIAQLESRGTMQRLTALRNEADRWLATRGEADAVAALPTAWQSHWQTAHDALVESADWHIQTLAAQASDDRAIRDLPEQLLDAPTQARLRRRVDDFVLSSTHREGLPAAPMRRVLAPALDTLASRLPAVIDDAVQRSLANPGSRLQRAAWRVTGLLATLLPIAAAGWAGWRVLDAFRDGAINPAAYLSSNFAVNAALLLGLAWFIPWWSHRRLAPSREAALVRGLRQGFEHALDRAGVDVADALGELGAEHTALGDSYAAIWSAPQVLAAGTAVEASSSSPLLARLLVDAGVRASTHSSTDRAPVS